MAKRIIILFLITTCSIFADTKVLFIGDSLTEGYGIAKEKAYPYLLRDILEKKYSKKIEVINGSVSGSTTASGASRLKWFLRSKPEVLILALGANDGLRGIDLTSSKKNLAAIISMAKSKDMKVILAGMYMPPNYGRDYTKKFRDMFVELKKEYSVTLIPFLLEGVAAKKALNLSDGIHPNELGHKKMAENLLPYFRSL
ncbi:arylesterase [Halobacteriovorax sp. JY17]|uniref:arylesterase n=1 Tax=Halobacteriovorax sp. JY17 TaxID=2014617 RepID=UPI000C5F397B|nr:arylesterase [Halobacteriovorax sp. JY17]PIK15376.1 MAG: arylesterase [Halobacteriovorax sp. JY17]